MKVIYLAAGHAKLKYDNVVYQDMFVKRDLGGCMLDVDLNDFDILMQHHRVIIGVEQEVIRCQNMQRIQNIYYLQY